MRPSPRLNMLISALLGLAILWTFLARPGLLPELSSDTLYLDDLWQSFFDGRGFKAWHLPPAPSFFPDLILYALSTAAGQDLGLRHLLYALLQSGLLVSGAAFLFKRRLGLDWDQAFLAAATGVALYLAFMSPRSALSHVFAPTHHGGAVAAVLWMLALAPKPGARERGWSLAAWALGSWALVLSDNLVVFWGFLPLFAFLVHAGALRLRWSLAVLSGFLLCGATLLAWRHSGPRLGGFRLDYYLLHARGLFVEGWGKFGSLMVEEFLLCFLAIPWFGYLSWRFHPGLARFSAWSAGLSLIVVPLLGSLSPRYFYMILFMPALFLPALLFRASRAWPAPALGILTVLFLALRAMTVGPPNLNLHRAQIPAGLEEMLDFLGAKGPVTGYAEYWEARRLRMLSRGLVWTDPVHTYPGTLMEVGPNHWISNALGPDLPRRYVVMNGLCAPCVYNFFGKPAEKRYFGDLEVWYYPRDL